MYIILNLNWFFSMFKENKKGEKQIQKKNRKVKKKAPQETNMIHI